MIGKLPSSCYKRRHGCQRQSKAKGATSNSSSRIPSGTTKQTKGAIMWNEPTPGYWPDPAYETRVPLTKTYLLQFFIGDRYTSEYDERISLRHRSERVERASDYVRLQSEGYQNPSIFELTASLRGPLKVSEFAKLDLLRI